MPQNERICLSVTNGFVVTVLVLLFVCGTRGSAVILISSLIHELAHLAAVWLCGGSVSAIRCGSGGLTIESAQIGRGYAGELICLVAGALSNLVFGLLLLQFYAKSEYLYMLAGANLTAGLFNLVPAGVFDGGRILYLCAEYFVGPVRARAFCVVVSAMCMCLVFSGGILLFWRSGRNLTVLLTTLYLSFLLGYDIIVSFPGRFHRRRTSA